MRRKVNIFIYRPDLAAVGVIPELCRTLDGQTYCDWQRDQNEIYQFKIEQAKHEIAKRQRFKRHWVEVCW
ncbi:MAG: hypothetical protein IJ545_04630 [Alphaproteobacteria bacterium]|nr:hypothetical protein [Alphaproteobacteria bacterium]